MAKELYVFKTIRYGYKVEVPDNANSSTHPEHYDTGNIYTNSQHVADQMEDHAGGYPFDVDFNWPAFPGNWALGVKIDIETRTGPL